jgi:hypothetical protein
MQLLGSAVRYGSPRFMQRERGLNRATQELA